LLGWLLRGMRELGEVGVTAGGVVTAERHRLDVGIPSGVPLLERVHKGAIFRP
jgi:hypothetical protein